SQARRSATTSSPGTRTQPSSTTYWASSRSSTCTVPTPGSSPGSWWRRCCTRCWIGGPGRTSATSPPTRVAEDDLARPSLLVRHAHVLTMSERGEFADGFVAVDGDRILGVGPDDECSYDDAERVIDGRGMAVLPGFVNAHTHAIHILMRGGRSDD